MSELAIAGNDAITVARHIDQIKTLGQTLVRSGLLPTSVKTPEAAVAIILKGRELGIPPMQALSHIHVISGKPSLSAELMMALVLQAGHEVWVSDSSEKACTVKGVRRGTKREQSLTFTMSEAERAGVTKNPTWKSYPAAMLRARAISAFLRMFAPDVLMGASYTPEELGADVDVDGNVVTVEATHATPEPTEAEEVVDVTPEPEPEGIGGNAAARLHKKLAGIGLKTDEHYAFASAAVNESVESLAFLSRAQAIVVSGVADKVADGLVSWRAGKLEYPPEEDAA